MAGLARGRWAHPETKVYIHKKRLVMLAPPIYIDREEGALAEALPALLYFEGSLIHIDDSRLPGLVTND